jgi:hypothetical protein
MPQKYPQQFRHFSRVEDDFNYENKLQPQNIYWNVHHINIELHGKKNQILAKSFHLFSSI